MEIALLLAVIMLFLISAIGLQLWKSSRRLFQHQHVSPLAIALPVQGEPIQLMINDMSHCAGIPSPEVFVYRARLPNAFIASAPLRTELFISDEALEEASESANPLDTLAQLIGHELAHIKLRHGLYHVTIMYIAQSTGVWLTPLKKICLSRLNKLEVAADKESAIIAGQYFRLLKIRNTQQQYKTKNHSA